MNVTTVLFINAGVVVPGVRVSLAPARQVMIEVVIHSSMTSLSY